MRKPEIINFTKETLDSLLEDANSCVTINNRTYSLALYPYHLSNVSESIKRILNAKVAKYDQRLDGILLGYKNLKLITPYASLKADSCYIHVDIQGDFYIFKPKVGAKLTGIVNKTSKTHIGCLVHNVFNVSAPNNNENESWSGGDIEVGSTVELSIMKTQLDARLPYIMASIVSVISKKKITTFLETETENAALDDSPKKQKKKKKYSNQVNDVVDNLGIDLSLQESLNLNDSTKKQKKKRHSVQTEIIINELLSQESLKLNGSGKKEKKKKQHSDKTKEIINEISSKETSILNNTDKTQKKNKRHSEQAEEILSEVLPNETLKLNDSGKKQKKKKHPSEQAEEIVSEVLPETSILNDSGKKQKKKKRHFEQAEEIVSEVFPETLTLNDSGKKQKKRKRHSEQGEEIVSEVLSEETSTLNDTVKKQKKKNRHSDKIDSLNVKVEELSQSTQILNESMKKQLQEFKKDSNNMNEMTVTNKAETSPKKLKLKRDNKSQSTNESAYFATPKIKKKQTPLTKTNKESTEIINVERNSLEDFILKEKKSKKRNSSNKFNESELNNTNTDLNSKTDSAKKKKNKQKVASELLNENSLTESRLEVLRNSLLSDQLKILKEKKRKSKEITSDLNRLSLSPIKPMADLEDRKNKKRRQSVSQNVDWENKELNLYDSDLEKTLNTSSQQNQVQEKSLEFNLAKIEALNANTPRKRKRKAIEAENDMFQAINIKKAKITED